MKNILVYLMLAATFLLSACDKDEKMLEPSYLPVTYANIAGTWQLAEWNGVEMSEGRYCYLVIKRKADEETGKRALEIYTNIDSDKSHLLTSTYELEEDEDLGSIISGIYDHAAGFWNNSYLISELEADRTALINNIYQSSDYLVCTEAGTDIWEEPKSGSSYQRYHSYNGMKTDDSYYYKVWQYSYLCINSCNIVIDGAENVTGDETEINECVAQARCLRAYYYMNLVEQFGNVDLQLKAADSENISFDAHRSTVPEIYAAIIEDLKFAVENLPVSFSDYYSRVTKKSAMGLLARAYINGAGYDLKDTDGVSFLEKAYDTATTMINNKAIYEWYMHPAFADVFNENNNRNNEEALFIAAGAERNSDAYTNGNYSQSEMFRHFLPSLGTYTDLGLVDKTSNFVYGRVAPRLLRNARGRRRGLLSADAFSGNVVFPPQRLRAERAERPELLHLPQRPHGRRLPARRV